MTGGRWSSQTRIGVALVGVVLVALGVLATMQYRSEPGAAALVIAGVLLGLAGVAGGQVVVRSGESEGRISAAGQAQQAGDSEGAYDRFVFLLRAYAPRALEFHEAANTALYDAAGREGQRLQPIFGYFLGPIAMSGSLIVVDIRAGTGFSIQRMQATYQALLVGPTASFEAALVIINAAPDDAIVSSVNQLSNVIDRPVVAVAWRLGDRSDGISEAITRVKRALARRAATAEPTLPPLIDEDDLMWADEQTQGEVRARASFTPEPAALAAERERTTERERAAELERAAFAAERERADRERAERDQADRERAEQQLAELQKAERERVERERAERERADRERVDRERADRERAEREYRDQVERERVERERVERERERPLRAEGRAAAPAVPTGSAKVPASRDEVDPLNGVAANGPGAWAAPEPRRRPSPAPIVYEDAGAWQHATDLHWRGQLQEAEDAYRTIVESRAQALGWDHPDTLTARDQHATVLRDLDRLGEALVECDEVLTARVRQIGDDHPDTLTSRSHLATIYHQLGDLTRAETEHQLVLEARTRVLGANHQETLISRSNLAKVYQDMGELDRAIQEHHTVMHARTKLLGPEHRDTLMSRSLLASALHHAGRLVEAEAEHRTVLGSRLRLLGPVHLDTAVSRHRLASVLHDLGRLDEAIVEYRAAQTVYSQLLGPQSPFARAAASDLALAERTHHGAQGARHAY